MDERRARRRLSGKGILGFKNSLKGHIPLMALGELRSQSVVLFILIFIIASVTSKEFFFPYGQKRFRSISKVRVDVRTLTILLSMTQTCEK